MLGQLLQRFRKTPPTPTEGVMVPVPEPNPDFSGYATTVDKVVALYNHFSDAVQQARWEGAFSHWGSAEERIRADPLPEITVEALEQIEGRSVIREFLPFLPPEVIVREFGEDVLLCLYFQGMANKHLCDMSLDDIDQHTSYDAKRIDAACLGTWHNFFRTDFEAVMRSHALIQAEPLKDLDLPALLAKHATEPSFGTSKALSRYSLQGLCVPRIIPYKCRYEREWGDKVVGRKRYAVFLDEFAGFGLFYKGEPAAVLSWSAHHKDDSALTIAQLQVVRPYKLDADGRDMTKMSATGKKIKVTAAPRGLGNFHVQGVLVEAAMYLAGELGYNTVRIQSGHNNKWTQPGSKGQKPHLPLDIALKIYDQTAVNMCFRQEENRNWYKAVG
jgi:hypothetical protein